jgi:hypothetical protein
MKRNLCGFLMVMMLVATPSVAFCTVVVEGFVFYKTVNAL